MFWIGAPALVRRHNRKRMVRLSWSQIAAWRIRRHHLERRAAAGRMLAVASRLCGLHAQVMSSAELSLWARVERLDRQAVSRALWEDRTLVKTWAMRGTLHLIPASDLPIWHAALSISRRYRREKGWQRWLGITLEEIDKVTDAIGSALDGRIMTREELVKEVVRISGSSTFEKAALNGWGMMLKPAAFTGRLCFAPSVGQRVRFTHPRSWLREPAKVLTTGDAAVEITRRYLSAYGPATRHDFARWWGDGSVATARQWIVSLGGEVAEVELEGGDTAWMLAKHAREARDLAPGRTVSLVPAFDPYVIAASRHARNLLPGDLRPRVFRPQGWVSPVLLVNGRMDGVWRHELKGSCAAIAIEPFVRLPAWARRAAEEEAERLAAFLGGRLSLTWKV